MMKVIACFAISLDGKISPMNSKGYVRIGSDADIRHLQEWREQSDVVVFGGETFRAYPRPHRGVNRETVPIHCILTRTFNLPTEASYFKNQPAVPTIICSPEPAPISVQRQYPSHIDWLTLGAERPIQTLLENLKARGAKHILVEGGGQILALFLKERAVQELSLTLCPLLLGGSTAPDLLGGAGFTLDQAVRTEIVSLKRVEQELYLHLRLTYPSVV